MLKDLDLSHLEVVSAIKNISDSYGYKSVLTTITFVRKEHSFGCMDGLELALHKMYLEEENLYIKMQCSYIMNVNTIDENETIKVIFNDPNNKYREVSYHDSPVTISLMNDVKFVEDFFENSSTEMKKVYM